MPPAVGDRRVFEGSSSRIREAKNKASERHGNIERETRLMMIIRFTNQSASASTSPDKRRGGRRWEGRPFQFGKFPFALRSAQIATFHSIAAKLFPLYLSLPPSLLPSTFRGHFEFPIWFCSKLASECPLLSPAILGGREPSVRYFTGELPTLLLLNKAQP